MTSSCGAITLTNRSESPRTIEVTSYAEVVLAPQAQDLAHPAFSNLFVQTELVRARQAILCTRRPRSAEERPPWMMHLMTVRGTTIGEPSYETDRMRFIGRGRTLASPAALDGQAPLSNSEGPVLDPDRLHPPDRPPAAERDRADRHRHRRRRVARGRRRR